MEYEPLIYFSSFNNANGFPVNFAEHDTSINIPFVGVYHFDVPSDEYAYIETIWYDFFKQQYFSFKKPFAFPKEQKENYIELCYVPGGILYIWKVSPQKSVLFKTNDFIQSVNRSRIEQVQTEWVDFKEEIQKKIYTTFPQSLYKADLINMYVASLMKSYVYRYQIQMEKWKDEDEEVKWEKYKEDEEKKPEFDWIEEALYDGTHDKLHDGGLMKYHEAGKPKKLAVQFHRGKTEYTAYFWFEDEKIREVFDRFYGAHPETKTDFIIRIDAEKKKYELALYRYGLKEPVKIKENVYQLIVFKNKFEDYRSDNYNQPRGAWIW